MFMYTIQFFRLGFKKVYERCIRTISQYYMCIPLKLAVVGRDIKVNKTTTGPINNKCLFNFFPKSQTIFHRRRALKIYIYMYICYISPPRNFAPVVSKSKYHTESPANVFIYFVRCLHLIAIKVGLEIHSKAPLFI